MTRSQELLAGVALTTFRLHGQLLGLSDELARPSGLTAAWWQVLGAVVGGPLPVSGIAREMGLSRQAVQRVADLLVERGHAVYEDNPEHRRAKLFVLTDAGRDTLRSIGPRQRRAADRLVADLGEERLGEVVAALRDLTTALDRLGL